MKKPVKKILIAGGGRAGWTAAAALSERYKEQVPIISLVESDQIGMVGVGEATVPGKIQPYQLSKREFIRVTEVTFILGIELKHWYQNGYRFFPPFAAFYAAIAGQIFYQCWLKLYKSGLHYNLEGFCLLIGLAKKSVCLAQRWATTSLALYSYAYHLEAN